MNMGVGQIKKIWSERQKLIDIDERFEKWTDYRDSLIDKAKYGRYIEVWDRPRSGVTFVTGNYDQDHAEKRYWDVIFPFKGEKESANLIAIIDSEEKKDVTTEMMLKVNDNVYIR